MGYLTPDAVPANTTCRVLFIPDNAQFIANVTGAVEALTFPENWVMQGTLTPQESADALLPMFDLFCFQQGVCRVIGEIVCWSTNTSPDANWLACDGASLLRTNYPDLFAVIGTTYGAADATHFNVPDLQGRAPIMAGSGTGLSSYNVGDAGGAETHTLTVTETPSHAHADTGHTHAEGTSLPALGAALVGIPIPAAIPAVGVTGIGFAGISNTGGGGSHNNIQPYLAINYLIVAK